MTELVIYKEGTSFAQLQVLFNPLFEKLANIEQSLNELYFGIHSAVCGATLRPAVVCKAFFACFFSLPGTTRMSITDYTDCCELPGNI